MFSPPATANNGDVYMYGGVAYTFENDLWRRTGAAYFAREVLQADRTYYVSTTGDDANDGLTTDSAWATIQHAVDTVIKELDLNQYQVTIKLANGTYSEHIVTYGEIVGGVHPDPIVIQGDESSPVDPSNVTITGATTAEVNTWYTDHTGGRIAIRGVTLARQVPAGGDPWILNSGGDGFSLEDIEWHAPGTGGGGLAVFKNLNLGGNHEVVSGSSFWGCFYSWNGTIRVGMGTWTWENASPDPWCTYFLYCVYDSKVNWEAITEVGTPPTGLQSYINGGSYHNPAFEGMIGQLDLVYPSGAPVSEVLLKVGSWTNVDSVVFAWDEYDAAAFNQIIIRIFDCRLATGGTYESILGRLSTDGGSTFLSTSIYTNMYLGYDTSKVDDGYVAGKDVSATGIWWMGLELEETDDVWDGEILLSNPSSTSLLKCHRITTSGRLTNDGVVDERASHWECNGYCATTSAINAMTLWTNGSVNWTGKYRIYGVY